jgi:NADH:ubiquinone oxidoreductase subunit 5 (subunit L)/multisubunit Na+/H+ antiporter MnhA subunit
LCAGRVIHLYGGRQDVRDLRVVGRYIPWTGVRLGACSFALGGVPFLSAFYSKDKIIEERFEQGLGPLFLIFLIVSIALTIMYSLRLVRFIVGQRYSVNLDRVEDIKPIMWPIRFLTLGAILGGRCISWLFLDLSYDNLFFSVKAGLLFMLSFGLISGLLINFPSKRFVGFYLRLIWFLVAFSTKLPLFFGLNFRGQIWKWWDAGWNEKLGPKGVSLELSRLASFRDYNFHWGFKYYLLTAFLLTFIWGSYILCLYSLSKA